MWDMTLVSGARANGSALLLLGLLGLIGCTPSIQEAPLQIHLHQQWQVQPGQRIVGYPVISGLGDISLDLQGQPIYAPFNGKVRPATAQLGCVFFSSPEVPAYLLRLCGLKHPQMGNIQAGEAIGHADTLVVATLRKQPAGNWALVEPSTHLLEQLVEPP